MSQTIVLINERIKTLSDCVKWLRTQNESQEKEINRIQLKIKENNSLINLHIETISKFMKEIVIIMENTELR